MKQISILLIAMMVFMVGFTRMKTGTNEVVLTASQVLSAADIENAIHAATQNGTRPGIVTLDASAGEFIYADYESDRSIDIHVSDITIRSENGAVIRNCDNGVFLDTLSTAHDITLEGISFHCRYSGVLAWGGHENITVQGNQFYVFGNGVYIFEGRNWTITGNYMEVTPTSVYPIGAEGVYILASDNIEVSHNQMFAGTGVLIAESENVRVVNNEIAAVWYGIKLSNGASSNLVRGNHISGVQEAGILFGIANEYNKVLRNTVQCRWGYDCLLYFVDETSTPLSPTNRLINNKLILSDDTNTFTTRLLPGFWGDFNLGPASDGTVHVVDVTPLHNSVDGAHTPFMIVPYYDGEQWVDLLRVTVPVGAPSEEVQITVYELSGLDLVMNVTDSLYPGARRSYPISLSTDNILAVYFADLDPPAPSVEGMSISDFLIRPEFLAGEWRDALLIQMPDRFEPDPLNLHMQVYAAEFLSPVADFNVVLTQNHTWAGFILGPSSLERGYVVRMFPVGADTGAIVDYYRIQPEFNGFEWYDVLRIRMGNLGGDWQSMEYNIKVYACEASNCP